MMAARRHPILPGIVLAPGLPLTGNPPTADLFGLCRIAEVEDHYDIADVPFRSRRDISVAAVEIETVYAAARGSPLADQLRIGRVLDVVNVDAAADVSRRGLSELFLIDDHDAVGDPHLVRMPALAHGDLRDDARRARIGDVDDGRA